MAELRAFMETASTTECAPMLSEVSGREDDSEGV
jgi:hypothetical protein